VPGPASTARSGQPSPAPLGDVHARMVDAIIAGGGLAAVAELAADAIGGTVAIVAPAEGVAIIAPLAADARLSAVRRYVTDRLVGQPVRVPQALAAEASIPAGAQSLGSVVLLADGGALSPMAGEVLRLAALLVVSALALDRAGAGLPAGGPALVRALRERPGADAAVVLAQAGDAGLALAHGAIGLCAEEPDRAGWVVPTIAEQFPAAPALRENGVVWALLPLTAGDDGGRATTNAARRVARRLGGRTAVGLSPIGNGPERLHRALHQARIALELVRAGEVDADEATTGTWRLLLGTAVADQDELSRCVISSIGPALEHDARFRTEFVATFRAYLIHGGNMNATAAAIYAHRHTVAARLERVRALTGLDPVRPDDRERLGVGVKAQLVLDALDRTAA
jgi:PucR family transcriptional regulator, purine catabolism regulatory protein